MSKVKRTKKRRVYIVLEALTGDNDTSVNNTRVVGVYATRKDAVKHRGVTTMKAFLKGTKDPELFIVTRTIRGEMP